MALAKLEGWDAFDLAAQHLRRLYIDGPPGVGKTTAGALLANGSGLTQVTLNEDTVVQELVGHYVPKGSEFLWHDGPVTTSFRQGGVLVVNELQRASGAVQDMFLAVLDDAAVAVLTLPTGERVAPHSSFRVVATSNSDITCLDLALADRFDAIVTVSLPHPKLVAKLNELFKGLGTLVNSSYNDPERAISPRRALTFAHLTKAGVPEMHAASLAFRDRAGDVIALLKLGR